MILFHIGGGHYTKVSEEDFRRAEKYEWKAIYRHSDKSVYAYRVEDGKKIYLDRFLANCPDDKRVVHKDGDTLNNFHKNFDFADRFYNHEEDASEAFFYGDGGFYAEGVDV